ncbi:MAG: hypothetical protein MAG715_00452 [Methanonatronarchaeales archaeon]|nr:hypothetical protein [Methanonatronarchaeales archaeon]
MTDLRRAVARAFQVENARSLTRDACKKTLSLKLNWFEPSEADRVIELALMRGLLEEDGGELRPLFDTGEAEVPLEFSPAVSLDRERVEGSAERAISEVAGALGKEKNEVVAGANSVQHELGNVLSMDAAVLVYALRNGVRLGDLAGEYAEELRA